MDQIVASESLFLGEASALGANLRDFIHFIIGFVGIDQVTGILIFRLMRGLGFGVWGVGFGEVAGLGGRA